MLSGVRAQIHRNGGSLVVVTDDPWLLRLLGAGGLEGVEFEPDAARRRPAVAPLDGNRMSAPTKGLERSSQDARSQLLFRELNEQLRKIAGGGDVDVVCECVNGACFDRLVVARDEYEAVRRFPTRFIVKEGHVAHDVERAVESHDGYVVVEKSGDDAENAIMLDPRRNVRGGSYAVKDLDPVKDLV